MNPFPEINARHSVLTRISEDALGILKEIFEDVETRRFLPELYELLDYPDGLPNFIATFVYYSQNDEGYLWGIKHSDEFVGLVFIYLTTLNIRFLFKHSKLVYYGYLIGNNYFYA